MELAVTKAAAVSQLAVLRSKAADVIHRLFHPTRLVQAGYAINIKQELRNQFESAVGCYRRGDPGGAYAQFLEVARKAEAVRRGAGRTAHLNAAACAIAQGQSSVVVELLQPIQSTGRLYAGPLWNLGLAYYQLGNLADSLKVIRIWIARAPESLRAAGLLVAAAVSMLAGDETDATLNLNEAIRLNKTLVSKQLGLKLEGSRRASPASFDQVAQISPMQIPALSAQQRDELLMLLLPKRPGRSPLLSAFLTREEIEQFAKSVESIAESGQEQAIADLIHLRDRHPGAGLLDMAVASCELFAGHYDRAFEILTRLEESGVKLPGSALWNLACSQARLGDFDGVLRSLRTCAETEFRTKSELWMAIKILGGGERTSPPPSLVTPSRPKLLDQLPESIEERRLELLRRLIIPGKPTRNYRPDLGRLPERFRRGVERVIDAAYKAAPSEALSMLLPLIRQYPDIYTLKSNAAAFALLSGDVSQASVLLGQAQAIRPLDGTSVMNLAFTHLTSGDIPRLCQTLEMGTTTGLSEKALFWLSFAICRAVLDSANAGEAAWKSLSLAVGENLRIVKQALTLCAINPTSTISAEDPTILVARAALRKLKQGDSAGAAACIAAIVGPAVAPIPEIGRRVLEPQFLFRHSREWSKEHIKLFHAGVRSFQEGRYGESATDFGSLYRFFRKPSVAVNMTAAYLKAGEPKRVKTIAGKAMREHRSDSKFGWMLVYNFALACFQLKDVTTAVRALTGAQYPGRSLTALLAALCASETKGNALRGTMASALDDLRGSVNPPSNELMLALSWAKLTMQNPDIPATQAALSVVANPPEREALHSPAEVVTVREVHSAYKQLSPNIPDAIAYLQNVIDTRTRERESPIAITELPAKEIERSVAVELAARLYVIRGFDSIGNREKAIQALEECEILLQEHSRSIPAGFLAKDWFDLAKIACSLGLSWSGLRFCVQGLTVDPEYKHLQEFCEKVKQEANDGSRDELVVACRGIAGRIIDSIGSPEDLAGIIRQELSGLDIIRRTAPSFSTAMDTFLQTIDTNRNDARLGTELSDHVNMFARMELPADALKELDPIFNWAGRISSREENRIPVEIDPHEGQIWPRSDEREACCLLALTARADVQNLTIFDQASENLVWHGNILTGKTEYVRWVVERDDGFAAGDLLDFSLTLESGTADSAMRTAISVSVASTEPRWPTYPTGALSPDDVPGNELYGRSDLIRKITSSLGKRRGQATYLIEAPRQMGKTSLLNFVKHQVPDHLLAVYVNLELPWSKKAPRNPWDYLTERVLLESGSKSAEGEAGRQPQDLIRVVSDVCNSSGKQYVLLLLDDLHSLLERCEDPRSVLAVFRDFHNDASNRISLLLADRYTREELESKFANEYWAQLSILSLGPLDRQSTGKAITIPAEDTDVGFLSETVDRLHYWTGGYPYHLQRAVQYMLDNMWSGPWLTAISSDVDEAIFRMLEEDALFQAGLCRPDRIDPRSEEVIAALLEWRDLVDFLPTLSTEPEWARVVSQWKPKATDLVASLGNPELLLTHLAAIGVMARRSGMYEFFSPLLERWLHKMRDHGRSLRSASLTNAWGILSAGDGAALTGDDWQRLDNELVRRCRNARIKVPLKERASSPDDWRLLIKEVTGQEEFKVFLSTIFGLFIDGREDKEAMLSYPWLTLAYHRSRLVRNYFEHASAAPSLVALQAWNQVCTRALGRECKSYTPTTADEWRAIQVLLLRTMFAGLKNAIALVGLRSSEAAAV
jgi:tetratricopeptide (TPR) repeat protein